MIHFIIILKIWGEINLARYAFRKVGRYQPHEFSSREKRALQTQDFNDIQMSFVLGVPNFSSNIVAFVTALLYNKEKKNYVGFCEIKEF